MLMISRMHPYHEVQEEFASTVNHLVDLRVQVDHLVVQQVEQIALSVDPEWSVDLAGMEVSMGAASIRIAKAKDKNGD